MSKRRVLAVACVVVVIHAALAGWFLLRATTSSPTPQPPSAANLAGNPSLEDSAEGWIVHPGGVTGVTHKRDASWAADGKWSLRHVATAQSDMLDEKGLRGFVGSYQLAPGTSGYPVKPGLLYTASTRVKVIDANESGPGVWEELWFFDAKGVLVARFDGPSQYQEVKAGETTVDCRAIAPTGAVTLQPVVALATATPGDRIEFLADDFRLVASR